MRSRHISVAIDLNRVRASAERIRTTTGVALIAVIKADAYGLGAARVADVLASVADEFAYFSIHEAREVGRPGLVLGPPEGDPAHYRELSVRPTVFSFPEAERFVGTRPVVGVDTGMQRFGCRPEDFDALRRRSGADEAYTHANDALAAERFRQIAGGRVARFHAASTSLLDCPAAWFDAVRPGLALYRGAVRVATRLTVVRETCGPVGYTGFLYPRVGVILAGYCHYLRPGPVLINGRRQRVLEVGMNTSYVSVDPADRADDEVVLLGDGLEGAELARHFGCREHEILCRYTSLGQRIYLPDVAGAASRPGPTHETRRAEAAPVPAASPAE